MFLLPFFVQENTRQFRQARNNGLFDGERMSGLPDWRIRLRLLRYRLLGNFTRQVLYCAIFMMLFDFSFYDDENVKGTYQSAHKDKATVFVQAGVYYKGKDGYQGAESFLKADKSLSTYRNLLMAFSKQVSPEHSAQPLVKQFLEQPWRILITVNREQLRQLIRTDNLDFSIKLEQKNNQTKIFAKNSFFKNLFLSKNEQNAIFFKYISDYYIYMNVLVLFGMFLLVFSLFDMRKLFQNA
ncbi:hypothetical protein BGP_0720 [Beggiatoa sp. PS]|nr:hypothetical protein BGP_0720 [Beggiatoa sp. PS]